MFNETQKTIHDWVAATFPNWCGIQHRALAVLEEAAEVCIAAGVSDKDMRAALEVPIKKSILRGEAGVLGEELADTQLNILAIAEQAGINVQDELNKKMALNRSRPLEYYQMKSREKARLGMPIEVPLEITPTGD